MNFKQTRLFTLDLDDWDASWVCHCLLGSLFSLVGLQHSHRLIHLKYKDC